MPTRAILTYQDYTALPDDGRRYELYQGELSVTPAPSIRHQGAIIALASRLYEHAKSRGLGKVFIAPTDCILSNVTVVQPDVLYIAADRLSIISERAIEGAPTLVVEVLAPTSVRLDRDRKMKLYAEHGVPYYCRSGRSLGGGLRSRRTGVCARRSPVWRACRSATLQRSDHRSRVDRELTSLWAALAEI